MRWLLKLFLKDTRFACLVLAGVIASVLNQGAKCIVLSASLVNLKGMGRGLLEDSSFSRLRSWSLDDSLWVRKVESRLINVLIDYLKLNGLLVFVMPDVLNRNVDLTLLKLSRAHILHDYSLVQRDRPRGCMLLEDNDAVLAF